MHTQLFEKFPIVNLMFHQLQKSSQNRIVMTGETVQSADIISSSMETMFIYETRLICQD